MTGFQEEMRDCRHCGTYNGDSEARKLKKCPCDMGVWYCSGTVCQKLDVCFIVCKCPYCVWISLPCAILCVCP